jgi:hypothetical protein
LRLDPVGLLGGHFAEHRDLHAAPLLLPCSSYRAADGGVLRARGRRCRARATAWNLDGTARGSGGTLGMAGGCFISVQFSPSFGPAFLYYQTDVLRSPSSTSASQSVAPRPQSPVHGWRILSRLVCAA